MQETTAMYARELSAFFGFLLAAIGGYGMPCLAGSLQVSTVTLDVASPGAATAIGLRNSGAEPLNAQLRVFKWTQRNGTEELTNTDEVAVSPPFAAIEPGREYTVRIVRVARAQLLDEASYRLLIDELPKAGVSQTIGVKFAVRYSIPVFFGPVAQTPTSLQWRAEAGHQQLRLIATNLGKKRVRLAALKLAEPGGAGIIHQDGLVGYVLGGSTMSWTFPISRSRPLSGPVLLVAESGGGQINAQVPLSLLP
jgi:fimbrial chaperone protein